MPCSDAKMKSNPVKQKPSAVPLKMTLHMRIAPLNALIEVSKFPPVAPKNHYLIMPKLKENTREELICP